MKTKVSAAEKRDIVAEKQESQASQAYYGVESGVDFANRRVYLVGDVDDTTVAKFLLGFQMLDASAGDIEVVLYSCGGEVNAGFGIYDAMRTARNKVVVKVFGQAMSIAALILQGGDKRLVSPTTRFMIHDGFEVMYGNYSGNELTSRAKEFQAGNRLYYEALAERSVLTVEQLQPLCEKETYMSAQRVVHLKLADAVIPTTKIPKKKKVEEEK